MACTMAGEQGQLRTGVRVQRAAQHHLPLWKMHSSCTSALVIALLVRSFSVAQAVKAEQVQSRGAAIDEDARCQVLSAQRAGGVRGEA